MCHQVCIGYPECDCNQFIPKIGGRNCAICNCEEDKHLFVCGNCSKIYDLRYEIPYNFCSPACVEESPLCCRWGCKNRRYGRYKTCGITCGRLLKIDFNNPANNMNN